MNDNQNDYENYHERKLPTFVVLPIMLVFFSLFVYIAIILISLMASTIIPVLIVGLLVFFILKSMFKRHSG